MSIPTLILGDPGTGKTSALRNMNPAETLLIQVVKKPLPFRSKDWQYFDAQNNPGGNIFVADTPAEIVRIMQKTRRKVICIDDANYVMSNAFLRRAQERGYEKFIEIAQETHLIFNAAFSSRLHPSRLCSILVCTELRSGYGIRRTTNY